MHRREVLKAGLAATAAATVAPRLASANITFTPMPKGWRSFALTTRVEPNFADKAWIPLPTFQASDWQRPGEVTWTGNAKTVEKLRDPRYGAEMLRVVWPAEQQNPAIEVTAKVQTQDRSVRPGQGSAPPLSEFTPRAMIASLGDTPETAISSTTRALTAAVKMP